MIEEYDVLFSDEGKRTKTNQSLVKAITNYWGDCYGYCMYGMRNLQVQSSFADVNVFVLEFHGPINKALNDRENWANSLRIKVLEHTQQVDQTWYLSMVGDVPVAEPKSEAISLYTDLQRKISNGVHTGLKPIQISSWESGNESHKETVERVVVGVPQESLQVFFYDYWLSTWEGCPIQGVQLPPNQIETLATWNMREPDEVLLREIIDASSMLFYTYPAEHHHLVFVTNKFSFGDMCKMIKLDEIQAEAKTTGKSLQHH